MVTQMRAALLQLEQKAEAASHRLDNQNSEFLDACLEAGIALRVVLEQFHKPIETKDSAYAATLFRETLINFGHQGARDYFEKAEPHFLHKNMLLIACLLFAGGSDVNILKSRAICSLMTAFMSLHKDVQKPVIEKQRPSHLKLVTT